MGPMEWAIVEDITREAMAIGSYNDPQKGLK
jgi:hypothetical protein